MMKYVWAVLGWIFGVLFVILAVTSVATGTPIAGAILLLTSLLVLPPVTAFLRDKVHVTIAPKVRGWSLVGLLFAFGAVGSVEEQRNQEEQRAKSEAVQAEAFKNEYTVRR
jgi:hypothetical protein